jgi:hypothetical protein
MSKYGILLHKIPTYFINHPDDDVCWGAVSASGIIYMGKFEKYIEEKTANSIVLTYIFEQGIVTDPDPRSKVFVVKPNPVVDEKTLKILETIKLDEAGLLCKEQGVSESTAQSTLESTAQSTLESTTQSTLESTAQNALESTAQSTLESTTQSTLESTAQSTLESTTQNASISP